MKNNRLYLLMVLILSTGANAQNFMQDVRADIQTKIQHLDPNKVSTAILYDRTLPLSNLPGYGSLHGIIPEGPSETISIER